MFTFAIGTWLSPSEFPNAGPILRSVCMMLPCCLERPFCATQAVHPENRLVLVGTIQAQIFGHHSRGDPAKLRREIFGYRFPAAMPQCLRVTARQAMARKVISRQAYLNRPPQLARRGSLS